MTRKGTGIVWTEKATIFGHKLLNCFLAIDKALKQTSATTPMPEWVSAPLYVLPKEAQLREQLLKVEGTLEELATQKEELKTKIVEEGSLRRLLYEGNSLGDSYFASATIAWISGRPLSGFGIRIRCNL